MKMGRKTKDTTGSTKKKITKADVVKMLIGSFALPLAVSLISIQVGGNHDNERLGKVEVKQKNLQKDVSEIQDKLDEQNRVLYTLQGQFTQMNVDQKNYAITIIPSQILISSLSLSSSSDIYGGTPGNITARSTDMAAASLDGNNNFTFKDLVSKKVVMPYTDGDEKVYFCGQYNDRMHWDGNCVLNAYKDNKLYFITEATYVDGSLLSYLQVFSSDDGKEWIASRRYVDSKGNYGVTAYFDKKTDIKKTFSDSQVSGSNLYLADEFIKNYISNGNDENMHAYYKGYTSGGYYNDDTGNAYLVKMDSDGDVLTLYHGGFRNGNFEDNSGKAWEITRKAKDASKQKTMKYMYLHGKFSDGKMVDGEGENNLSQKRINKITKNISFDVKLKWKNFSE